MCTQCSTAARLPCDFQVTSVDMPPRSTTTRVGAAEVVEGPAGEGAAGREGTAAVAAAAWVAAAAAAAAWALRRAVGGCCSGAMCIVEEPACGWEGHRGEHWHPRCQTATCTNGRGVWFRGPFQPRKPHFRPTLNHCHSFWPNPTLSCPFKPGQAQAWLGLTSGPSGLRSAKHGPCQAAKQRAHLCVCPEQLAQA